MFRLIRSAAPAAWRTVRLQPAIPGRVAKTVRFASSATEKQTRFERVNARLPKWLSKYTAALKNAPISHVTAFLVLHELTAVIPLMSLTMAFHYTQWLPPFISEWKWASDAMQKFGNYFRRKGRISAADDPSQPASFKVRWWGRGEKGSLLVAEVATAYVITKALLPLRILLSVWATPWFARTFIIRPASKLRTVFRRPASGVSSPKGGSTGSSASAPAGTGSVEVGALPRSTDIKTTRTTP